VGLLDEQLAQSGEEKEGEILQVNWIVRGFYSNISGIRGQKVPVLPDQF
jgi:hypothetical protein